MLGVKDHLPTRAAVRDNNSLLSYMANLKTVNVSTETSLVPFLPNSLIIYFNIVLNTASLHAFNLRKGHCALGQLIMKELGSQLN
jgi:hypothetical protein